MKKTFICLTKIEVNKSHKLHCSEVMIDINKITAIGVNCDNNCIIYLDGGYIIEVQETYKNIIDNITSLIGSSVINVF